MDDMGPGDDAEDDMNVELELPEGLMEELLGDEGAEYTEQELEKVAEAAEIEEKKKMDAYAKLRKSAVSVAGARQHQTTLEIPKTPTKFHIMFSLSGEAYEAYERLIEAAILSGGSVDMADAIVGRALVEAWGQTKDRQAPNPKLGMWSGSPEDRAAKQKEKRIAPKAQKVKECKTCGTTDPSKFYSYHNNICKECYLKRVYDRRASIRSSAGMKVKAKADVKVPSKPAQSKPVESKPVLKVGPEPVDRCAAEIRAAGPSGIYQRNLRKNLEISRYNCMLAVRELVNTGKVVRSGESSSTGSPRLVWKAPEPQKPKPLPEVRARGARPAPSRPLVGQKKAPHKRWYK